MDREWKAFTCAILYAKTPTPAGGEADGGDAAGTAA